MNKKALLVSLLASLGAGVVLAQDTNTVPPATPPSTLAVPAAPAPAAPVVAPPVSPAPEVAPAAPAVPAAKPKAKAKAKKPAAKPAAAQAATHALIDPPVTATAKVDALNMRGMPSFSGEVIAKLHKGETVTVFEEITLAKARQGEPAKWSRIALPTNTPVWVFAHLIDSNNTVSAKRINVRGGPGENFSVVGHLDKGTAIKEIRKNQGWLEIETPTNAFAFVAADFLDKQGPAAPAPTPATGLAPTMPAPTPVVPAPEVVTVAPDTNTVVMPAIDAAAAPAVVAPEPAPAIAAADTNALPVLTNAAPEVAAPAEPLPKRIISREGIVRKALNIQAPSYYELHDVRTGELLDYLNPANPEMQLKSYVGNKVVVTGEEAMDRRWKFTPVIEVESVETL